MLTSLLRFELGAFLFGVAIVVGYRLLTGAINTVGLFYQINPLSTERSFSPERVQLLLFTIFVGFWYLLQALDARGSGKLPDVPPQTLALLGGSHAVYLGGKAYSMLIKSANGKE